MELTGLEPRRSDLARGIVIVRSAHPLDHGTQRALWDALGAAGVTERDPESPEDGTGEPARCWHAAPWLPPTVAELDTQRAAFEAVGVQFEVEAIWCVKVETGIDGVAWLEVARAENQEAGDEAEPDGGVEEGGEEVLYAAPDAPEPADEEELALDEPDDDDDDDEELELDEMVESHWRNGPPPLEHAVGFPIERYPEIIEELDWDSFGIAIKLADADDTGEESVINAFFALWLSVYQDERAEEYEAFQRADVVHDRRHHAALMWVERFAVPASAADQVHFLLWIAARIHDILPIAWARFETVDDAIKARASGEGTGGEPFVLAGNPFADRFRRHGEEAALQWAVAQSAWSKRELAGMLVEVALEHDPDEPVTAAIAERLLRRALAFDRLSDATGYLAIVLVRRHRIADAIALARGATDPSVRLLVVGETAEHATDELPAAVVLLDPDTTRATEPEELAELTATVARQAPQHIAAMLERLPDVAALVPHLYNASFSVDRPQALAILRRVIALPAPDREAGEARAAYVMAWNNACIHAHALGDYRLAVQLADGGQPYAPENPYIYHSAACAYAAIGQVDRALEQVGRAIEHDYEHAEKMETDADLAVLQHDPRFGALFNEWRTRRADLN